MVTLTMIGGAAKNGIGQHESAVADFDEAIRINPSDITVYINRGETKIRSMIGMREALIDFDKVISLDPENAENYHKRWHYEM